MDSCIYTKVIDTGITLNLESPTVILVEILCNPIVVALNKVDVVAVDILNGFSLSTGYGILLRRHRRSGLWR